MTKHSFLVVGVGSIGRRHVHCFLATGRAEVAICEPVRSLRESIAQQYDLRAAYADIDQALEHQAEYEAVVLCVPAHLHIPIAVQFAQAGKHLLIEKPLSTGTDGIEPLITLVKEKELVAGVAYVYRHHPALQAMRESIRSGLIGEPVQLVAVSGQNFPTYRPAYREIYYADRSTGGGAIQDALTHLVDTCQWLVGPIDRLAADAAHQVLEGVEVEDTVHVIARHRRLMSSYSLNQHQAPNELTITVVGTQGTVRFENHQCRYRWMKQPDSSWHDTSFGPLERNTLFIAQAHHFLDAMERKQTPACPLGEARQTLAVNLAVLQASNSDCWYSIDVDR